jgi:Ser-tRNA(Ala) deacylase AlaX
MADTQTQILYLEDSYLKEWDAEIIEFAENNEKQIILDKTAFYPLGGGQPNDEGKIVVGTEEYKVLNVKKTDGKIVHELDHEGLKIGDKVHCILDWERRYKLMRMHTAAHILSAIINQQVQALITGNQLGLDKSRIDFDLETFDKEKMKSFVEIANQAITKGGEVTAYTISRQEAESKPNLCKLAKGLPPFIQEIRILKIAEIDEQPDGGTHVKDIKEIGKLVFLDVENKGAKRRRIYFTLENA